ncbi:hypothetical protein ACGFX8_36145 [Streptomyces sp. NPDC048362]|uniref:hypothetical protein n=1 Tax=Streptomyces sp. NPDC048362 TaxID=3365539 RepID=UPI003719C43E
MTEIVDPDGVFTANTPKVGDVLQPATTHSFEIDGGWKPTEERAQVKYVAEGGSGPLGKVYFEVTFVVSATGGQSWIIWRSEDRDSLGEKIEGNIKSTKYVDLLLPGEVV